MKTDDIISLNGIACIPRVIESESRTASASEDGAAHLLVCLRCTLSGAKNQRR